MIFNDWIKNENKKIIISNSNDFTNKIIKNYCVGFNTYIKNYKVLTIENILTNLLIFSKSKTIENFIIINDNIASTIIEYLLRKNKNESDYIYGFIPKTSLGGKTYYEIYKAIKQINLGNVIKPNEKYEKLMQLNYDYNSFLEKYNYYDYSKLLDIAVDFIYNHTKEEIIECFGFGNDFIIGIFDNVKLRYKEALFLDLIQKKLNIKIDYLSYIYEDNIVDNKFIKCYGLYNEVDFIAEKIISDKMNLSDINIFYLDNTYENYIRALFERRCINFRFDKANACATNLIQLFNDIILFYKNDFNYKNLYNVVKNPIFTFDKIIIENNLDKENYNKPLKSFTDINNENLCIGINRYIEFVNNYKCEKINNDLFVKYFLKDLILAYSDEEVNKLYLNIYNLIKKYTYINNEYISLKEKLDDLIIVFDIMNLVKDSKENNLDYISKTLSNLTFSEKEDDNSINIINLNSYKVLDRKYNFILGLSSGQIKKKEVESAIFSDEEYKKMLNNNYYIELAENINLEFNDILNKTTKTLYKGTIYYQYSNFDTIEFKPTSPSIFYLDKLNKNDEIYYTYKNLNDEFIIDKKSVIEKVSSYKNMNDLHIANINNLNFVDVSDKILDLNLKPDEVIIDETLDGKIEKKWSLSASGLAMLVTCPMCYCYKYVKFIPDLDFREPLSYAWLDPLAKGNLFHHTLENYSKDIFMKNLCFDENVFDLSYEKAINDATKEIPYPNEKIFKKEYDANKLIAKEYIINLHKFYDEEKLLNKFYINIGNELKFGNGCKTKAIIKDCYEVLINDKIYKTNYEISLNGSIDRLDGYLDGDVLHLLIIDYKTSKLKNLKDEIKEYTKIQHYIYSIAAYNYFDSEKEEIEKIFNHKIKSCIIDDMEYHLPFSFEILKWSEGFNIKNYDNFIPSKKEEIKLPNKIKEALGLVSLFKDGINIDILYQKLSKYYLDYEIKDANKYSNYKHICRYEIDSYSEGDEDNESDE